MSVMALSHQDASKIGSFPSSEMLAFWADTIFWHQRSYMEALLAAAREVDQLNNSRKEPPHGLVAGTLRMEIAEPCEHCVNEACEMLSTVWKLMSIPVSMDSSS